MPGGLPYIGRHFMELFQVARFLIHHGADAMARETPLYVASTYGSVELHFFSSNTERTRQPGTMMGGPRYMRRLVESWKSRASSSSAAPTRQYEITRGGYIGCGMERGKSSCQTRPHRTWRGHHTLGGLFPLHWLSRGRTHSFYPCRYKLR